ncbi:MAG: homogentisate phytyltransferase [Cyanobacteria bacterium QS_8_64_29]|nr:MAG: homogentisate phytyltransferase [Cyanobacteria bacterium QS_8_64_29]
MAHGNGQWVGVAGLRSLWKFWRPHTFIGTTLSVLSLYALVLATADRAPTLASAGQLLGTWLACAGGNLYIVGLNQIQDLAIDRVNKPHLPVAAGEISRQQAQAIVAVAAGLALALAGWLGPWLLATVGGSLAIGTAYSLPPVRLKRFPFWAAVSILSVRGAIVNVGLFLHFGRTVAGSAALPPAAIALALFVVVFSVAIALFKDVPDTEGDRRYGIATFTLLLGKRAIFNSARATIAACYLGIALAGLSGLPGANVPLLVGTHLGLLGLLWARSQRVNLQDNRAIARFYQFIWRLFFLEYAVFPAAFI